MIKIAILGPECSGKSTLAKELASHFHTSYVEEFARQYLEQQNGHYVQEDLLIMAKLQLQKEEHLGKTANKLLFCDTNLINFLIWSKEKYGSIDPELSKLWKAEDYPFTLLCYPDLPYEEDPLREHPSQEDRIHLFNIHKEYLKKSNSKYFVVKGDGEDRLQSAIEKVKKNLNTLLA